MHGLKVYLPPFARFLMSSFFIWDGILQLRDPGGSARYFAGVHVPAPDIAVWLSIAILIVGGAGDSGWLQDPMGLGFARALLPRNRVRRASACRGHGQHDRFLQEPGYGRRLPLRRQLRRRRYEHRDREGA